MRNSRLLLDNRESCRKGSLNNESDVSQIGKGGVIFLMGITEFHSGFK